MAPRLLLISILFAGSLLAPRPAWAQGSASGQTFARFVKQVEKQTGFHIAYAPGEITLSVTSLPGIDGLGAEEALWKVLDADKYDLITSGRHVVIKKKPASGHSYGPRPVVDPAVMVDKIPPPQQSVFSGQTRLIILRRDTVPGQHALTPGAPFSTRADSAAKRPAVKNIPFRSDLLQKEAYGTTGQPGSKKRKRGKNPR
ncbi:MAG: hypothetical protein LUE10_06625 [Alistipes sp.]|nr:hypothetical protein [Alistipes sp.]